MGARSISVPKLEDYHISEQFGLILPDPLERLPEYFQPWMNLAKNAREFTANGTIRDKVKEMPLLDHTRLEGYKEQRLAQLALSVIGSSYVWATKDKDIPKSVPKCLAIPWHGVSVQLGVKPHMNTINATFANYTLIDKIKRPALDNLKLIFPLPGHKNIDWIIFVAIIAEIAAAKGIKAVSDAQQGVADGDEEKVLNALVALKQSVDEVTRILTKLNDSFPAEKFLTEFMPYTAGWGEKGSPLPDGLTFEGVSTEPQKVIHYNQGQSPMFQIFDAALGIEYTAAHKAYFLTKRSVMLPNHRAFLEAVEKGPPVRTFVLASSNELLKNALNACIKKLAGFRTQHMRAVVRNTVVNKMEHTKEEEEAGIEKDPKNKEAMTLLKELYGHTKQFLIEEKD